MKGDVIMMDSGNLKVVFNLSSCKMPGIRGGDGVIMDGPLLTRRGDSLFFFLLPHVWSFLAFLVAYRDNEKNYTGLQYRTLMYPSKPLEGGLTGSFLGHSQTQISSSHWMCWKVFCCAGWFRAVFPVHESTPIKQYSTKGRCKRNNVQFTLCTFTTCVHIYIYIIGPIRSISMYRIHACKWITTSMWLIRLSLLPGFEAKKARTRIFRPCKVKNKWPKSSALGTSIWSSRGTRFPLGSAVLLSEAAILHHISPLVIWELYQLYPNIWGLDSRCYTHLYTTSPAPPSIEWMLTHATCNLDNGLDTARLFGV